MKPTGVSWEGSFDNTDLTWSNKWSSRKVILNVFLILRLALVVILLLLFLALSAAISGASGENARAAVVLVVEIDGPGVQEARTLFARAHVAWIRVLILYRNRGKRTGEMIRAGLFVLIVEVTMNAGKILINIFKMIRALLWLITLRLSRRCFRFNNGRDKIKFDCIFSNYPDVRNSELCVGEGFRIGWNPMTVNVLWFRQDVVNDPIPHEG